MIANMYPGLAIHQMLSKTDPIYYLTKSTCMTSFNPNTTSWAELTHISILLEKKLFRELRIRQPEG